jgi:hypothetical protein
MDGGVMEARHREHALESGMLFFTLHFFPAD